MRKNGIVVWLLCVSLTGLSAEANAKSPDPSGVTYHLDTITQGDHLTAVRLRLRFRADKDGKATLRLPDRWGGGDHFYERLKDLDIKGAKTVTTPEPAVREIDAKPYALITLSYRLEANRTPGQEVPLDTNYTYPVIAPDWFYITGPGLFAVVEGRDPQAQHFSWSLPRGWTGATNLQYPTPPELNEAADQSVLLAGKDVHIAQLKVKSGDLHIAWRGHFDQFSSDVFNASVRDIINAEQSFWGEGQDHFLVTLAPSESAKGGRSIRGSGLGESFAMVATPETELGALKIILAHEYFHSWNPLRLGGFDPDEEEKSGYWFSEGFTDYYARKLAYEGGAVDAQQFMATWNDALQAYAASPYRTAPNSVIVEKFWSDPLVQKLPYQRGSMLAVLLDARWRAQGKSMDGFIHVLRDQARADTARKAPHVKLIDRLNRAATAYGVDFGDLIDRYMLKGEAMTLPEDAFGAKFRVVSEDVPVRTLGYDPDKSRAAGAFVAVDPEGPAYRAGIREGMKRLRVESRGVGDGHDVITAVVEGAEGKPQTITFTATGKDYIRTQKLILR